MQAFSSNTYFRLSTYLLSFWICLTAPCLLQAQTIANDKVVIRLKSSSPESRILQFSSFLDQYQVSSKRAIHWSDPKARTAHPLADIYLVDVPEGMSVTEWLAILSNNESLVYAEPYAEHELLYIPNDPQATALTGQNYLSVIKAFDAWSITRGSSNIIIGILDSGTKTDHEDLSSNVAINTLDPINGIDDDQDGYIDNYWGWDMADNDNNPSPGISGHGTFVTGVSSAKADNGKGMAGIGFNSPFMPIKIYRSSDNRFLGGYEAIAYAADMGCKVINLSWGSAGNYLQYAQDIINYAVLEKDAVIVAAAGNTNAELTFYPASYENVLSVGATTVQDVKAAWATYSYHIDMVAPGDVIYSTNANGAYSRDNGSSFASPMVAGAAALVRARFPQLTAQQVCERLRITADDNIYLLEGNQAYQDKLGRGRLNIYRALTEEGIYSVRLTGFSYKNKFGKYAFPGDTLTMSLKLKNWLSTIGALKVRIESKSEFAEIISPTKNISYLATLETNELNDAFQIVIKDSTPVNTRIDLKVIFESNGYQDYQYITINTSPGSVKIVNNLSQITINQNGQIGNGTGIDLSTAGLFHNQKKVADHIGLIVASNIGKVSDNAVVRFADQTRSSDYEAQERLKLTDSSPAYFDIRNTLKENSSLINKTGIMVEQKLLAWPNVSTQNAWVIEYRLTNTTSSPINNVYIGNLIDVNIGNRSQNKTDYQAARKMLYSYGVDGEAIYVGMAPLSTSPFTAMALDLGSFNTNNQDVPNQINDTIKYNLLQQGEFLSKLRAGNNGLGNDVASIMGHKIASLPAYGSTKLAFVYVSGNTIDDLEDGFDSAKTYYQAYSNQPLVTQTLNSCPNTSITIDPINGDRFDFYTSPSLSQKIFTGNQLVTGNLTQDTTFYIQNIDNLYKSEVNAIRVLIKDAITDFNLPFDTLLLPAQGGADIQLTDLSEHVSIWHWQFGNGFQSSVKNPKITYSVSGNYNIKLIGKTAWGCESTAQKNLVVLRKAPLPEIVDEIRICSNDQVTIQAINTSHIRVYKDSNKSQLIYEGSSFQSAQLFNDTTFFISNLEGETESDLKIVTVDVQLLTADFLAIPDTTDLSSTTRFNIINQSINGHTFAWYINDELRSETSDPILDFGSLVEFNLKVEVQSESGCRTEKIIHFDNSKSTVPLVEEINICTETSFSIIPQNGNLFYFYADEDKNELLYKGSQFITNIHSDTLFYISNADGLIESELVPVSIKVIPVDASFGATLFSSVGIGSKSFLANNSTAKNWLWQVNSIIVGTRSTLQYNFMLEGEYVVKLTVTDQGGCKGSSEQSILVSRITGIDDISKQISIYPNPSTGLVEIQMPASNKPLTINITNVSGAAVFKQSFNLTGQNIQLHLEHVPTGLYFVELELEGTFIYKKIQIER